MIERIVIEKLDNGYCVSADTKRAEKKAHYCSNLKGVTKALWEWFEGKSKLTKEQVQGVKTTLKTIKGNLERQKEATEENEDA